MFDTQWLRLVVHFGIQSIRIPCIRPTVHLICGHSRGTVGLYAGETVCFVLSTKYFSSSTEYKSFRFPSYSPTVHLICRHSRATVGLYDGDTVCFVLSRNLSVPGTLPSVGSKQRQESLMISNIPNTCSDGCRSSETSCRCLDRRPICRLTSHRWAV